MITTHLLQVKTLLIALLAVSFSATAIANTTMTYMVPKGDHIQENVVLPLRKARLVIGESSLGHANASLDYRLPQELDGAEPKRFQPSGTKLADGSWFLTEKGKDRNGNTINIVEAVCTGTEEDFNCKMEYAKNEDDIFPLNIVAAHDYLATRMDLTPDQLSKIEGAQMALSHEAIGIVHAKKNRRGGRN